MLTLTNVRQAHEKNLYFISNAKMSAVRKEVLCA